MDWIKTKIMARHIENELNKALVFIPDISGFSEFSHNTDIILGKYIIMELLNSIIESNFLNLKISEIEGDAVLFYRYGKLPEIRIILDQYEKMLINFKIKLHEINLRLQTKINLSLKLIVHYGYVMEYKLSGFRKLYGEVLVEAHLLLKNSIKSKNYVLFTEQALLDSEFEENSIELPKWVSRGALCMKRKNMKDLCFSYYEYNIMELKVNVLLEMNNSS